MIALLLFGLSLFQSSTPAYPSSEELLRRVQQSLELDFQLQKAFTHLERRRDVKISKLGKVTVGPLRTFEVYPSDRPGDAYKRLIAVDGKPLAAAELARRDAEHERDLQKAAARERSETAEERADRLEEATKGQRHREAMLSDAMAVFEPTVVGREWIEGQPVFVADVKPRPEAHVSTREGEWMKRFAGRIWVAEANYQVVKIEMRAFEDITIGWGVIGRVHAGSRMLHTRRYAHGVWLPASLTYEASGRTLLFRTFEFAVSTTYSDYKRRGGE